MSVEEQLKSLILQKYSTIKQFSNIINLPYSTVDTIFKRGIMNARVTNVIAICKALDINIEELSSGNILTNDKVSLKNDYLDELEGTYNLDPIQKRILQSFLTFTPEQQESFIRLVAVVSEDTNGDLIKKEFFESFEKLDIYNRGKVMGYISALLIEQREGHSKDEQKEQKNFSSKKVHLEEKLKKYPFIDESKTKENR